eukprot:GHUV01051811.1.p1 GENE.GHUV01051811.1~~GHUV01051811.1.p1  ORF type:complete len:339 (+),score=84.52 GHUV01051811.1:497-1513(+)
MWTCVDSICSWCPRCERSQHLVQCLSWTLWTPCNIMFWEGVGLAVVSAVCNGSFTAFVKCQRVRTAQVPGYIINLWLCVGVCLASTPIAWATHLRCVSKEGLLSGVLFVLSNTANMHAIQHIGLHRAVGIGCGTAALVSFAYGAVAEPGSVTRWPQAILGIACLITGMASIAAAGSRQQTIEAASHDQPQQRHSRSAALTAAAADSSNPTAAWMQQPLLDEEHYVDVALPAHVKAGSAQSGPAGLPVRQHPGPSRAQHSAIKGLLLAVLTGVFGGLILAPMDHVGHECRGLPYQASLAVGVLLAAPVVTYCTYWLHQHKVSSSRIELAVPVMLQSCCH